MAGKRLLTPPLVLEDEAEGNEESQLRYSEAGGDGCDDGSLPIPYLYPHLDHLVSIPHCLSWRNGHYYSNPILDPELIDPLEDDPSETDLRNCR